MTRVVIEANRLRGPSLRSLIGYRDLFLTLAYRDFKVRYAQTFLGFLWAVLQPVVILVVFTIVFGRVVRVEIGAVPYPLFAITGLVGWMYFSTIITQSGASLIGSQEMIKKVYFPRIIIPLAKAYVGIVDLGINLILLGLLILFYNLSIGVNFLLAPISILFMLAVAVGAGAWFSALSVRYRDVQHGLPFIAQLGMYASPVVYPSSTLIETTPTWLGYVYFLNPAAGIIDILRWSILGTPMSMIHVLISVVVGALIIVSGYFYFHKVERYMADLI